MLSKPICEFCSMIMKTTRALIAVLAVAIIATPMTASASTVKHFARIGAGEDFDVSRSIAPSDDKFDRLVFKFKALDDFTIDGFALSMSGTNNRDVWKSRYRIVLPKGADRQPFRRFQVSDSVGAAKLTLPGHDFVTGDKFKVVFKTKAENATNFDVSFTTVPAQVPVPATGLLLLTAIGGAAALRRRKKKATA